MKTIQKVVLAITTTIIVATDAHAGRWISRDPIQEGAGFVQRDPMPQLNIIPQRRNEPNLYVFVRNNPANLIDPLGLHVYKVQLPSSVSGSVDHRQVVGDDGKGGSYILERVRKV